MNLLSVNKFIEANPSFTVGGMRNLIFHADSNGLNDHNAIVRIGRKVMIDVEKFYLWIKAQNSIEV
ncbi:hypothetical protein [Marinicella litoralis]|uniref:Uncharacterized protein n=1 Tax=Marinicella litoralis TaxID=644220 RepID=A0A4R6XY62_9GAMM|nr:hypothetical protein [Marinicella litoralis]TDR23147.1 hypothetical protein C8D91_0004 [Marinicella litoralis]